MRYERLLLCPRDGHELLCRYSHRLTVNLPRTIGNRFQRNSIGLLDFNIKILVECLPAFIVRNWLARGIQRLVAKSLSQIQTIAAFLSRVNRILVSRSAIGFKRSILSIDKPVSSREHLWLQLAGKKFAMADPLQSRAAWFSSEMWISFWNDEYN